MLSTLYNEGTYTEKQEKAALRRMSEPDLAPVVQHLKNRLLSRYEALSQSRDDIVTHRMQGAIRELEMLLGELGVTNPRQS